MVLAQEKMHRSTEQNGEPGNEPTRTQPMTKEKRICNGEKTAFSKMLLGKLDSYMRKKSNRTTL